MEPGRHRCGVAASALTEGAGTIPLRKAAAGGRSQELETQQGLFRGGVAVDFAAQGDFFEFGTGPGLEGHVDSPVVEGEVEEQEDG
jgi:hypothetical protein